MTACSCAAALVQYNHSITLIITSNHIIDGDGEGETVIKLHKYLHLSERTNVCFVVISLLEIDKCAVTSWMTGQFISQQCVASYSFFCSFSCDEYGANELI